MCVTNDHIYVSLAVITNRSFPNSIIINRLVTRVTRQVPLVEFIICFKWGSCCLLHNQRTTPLSIHILSWFHIIWQDVIIQYQRTIREINCLIYPSDKNKISKVFRVRKSSREYCKSKGFTVSKVTQFRKKHTITQPGVKSDATSKHKRD